MAILTSFITAFFLALKNFTNNFILPPIQFVFKYYQVKYV